MTSHDLAKADCIISSMHAVFKNPFLFSLLKYFQHVFHLLSSCKTLAFWTTQFKKLDLKPTPLPLSPFTDDETDAQGISWVVDPWPLDLVYTAFPSSTQLLFALLQVVKGRTPHELKLKSGMKKRALLILVTIFFSKSLEQRKFSASRNSLNQSHMWTWTQQFSTNITGFSQHIDFFFLLPLSL